ncbi:hypothetical protein GN958_ATG04927 [Phytophthora infestans]|nr:hypothetical protein GN958_ATG04927 [Phytophthora infestans]
MSDIRFYYAFGYDITSNQRTYYTDNYNLNYDNDSRHDVATNCRSYFYSCISHRSSDYGSTNYVAAD